MLNVILCEDNKKQRERFESIIKAIIEKNNLSAQFAVSAESPEEVIKYLDAANEGTGIYFLNIDFKSNMNGLELAKIIRKYDNDGYIIFITTHSEMTPLVFKYKIEAMDFIIKDDFNSMKSQIEECLLEACSKQLRVVSKRNDFLTVEAERKFINIDLNEILFFETADKNHKIRLHTLDSNIEFYSTMKELEERLKDDFCRTHRSYIVNLKNIKEVDKSKFTITMINDETCYISVRYMKEFLKRWKK